MLPGDGSKHVPVVHADDVGDLLRRIALGGPDARGIFHAAELAFASLATAPSRADLATKCSAAAGAEGAVKVVGAKYPFDGLDQSLGCDNSLALGWKPRVFDAKAAWAEYLAAKAGLAARKAKAAAAAPSASAK